MECLLSRSLTLWFYWTPKCDHCQTLRDGSTYWALHVHTTFNDYEFISWSQRCETVEIESCISRYPVKFKLCMVVKYMDWIAHVMLFWSLMCMEFKLCLFFRDSLSAIFLTLHSNRLYKALHFHSSFSGRPEFQGHSDGRKMKLKVVFCWWVLACYI